MLLLLCVGLLTIWQSRFFSFRLSTKIWENEIVFRLLSPSVDICAMKYVWSFALVIIEIFSLNLSIFFQNSQQRQKKNTVTQIPTSQQHPAPTPTPTPTTPTQTTPTQTTPTHLVSTQFFLFSLAPRNSPNASKEHSSLTTFVQNKWTTTKDFWNQTFWLQPTTMRWVASNVKKEGEI